MATHHCCFTDLVVHRLIRSSTNLSPLSDLSSPTSSPQGKKLRHAPLSGNNLMIQLLNVVICNASGSGKTRLLFEGLRTHWGFYFAAHHNHGIAASVDLSCVLADLKNSLTTLTPENRLLAERANTGISAHWSRSILYARILVFRISLTYAIKLGRISESLKHSWLFLQVAPRMCLGDPDIFQHLTLQVVHNIPLMLLALRLGQELDQVRNILGSSMPLFCVLDDAQVLSDKFTGCLVSREEPRQSQPF